MISDDCQRFYRTSGHISTVRRANIEHNEKAKFHSMLAAILGRRTPTYTAYQGHERAPHTLLRRCSRGQWLGTHKGG
jgi:hypothetical protein